MSLPAVPSLQTIQELLPLIFPEGAQERQWCIREQSARTIQVMFYAGAIEGADRWLLPNQVVNMTDAQMSQLDVADRESWYTITSKPKRRNRGEPQQEQPPGAWYSVNSREGVRDETLKKGLYVNGAIHLRTGIATTAMFGRYALKQDFAQLFEKAGAELKSSIEIWQSAHLSAAARARISLMRSGGAASEEAVRVTLPNGTTLALSGGESSLLTKALVEEFAPRFLTHPVVIWLSESQSKVIDASVSRSIGLEIDPSKVLPDAILADLDAPGGVLLVFCEVVHTDGPVSEERKKLLLETAATSGFGAGHVALVTIFRDRGKAQIRSQIGKLAWGSFVWFASEPDGVMFLQEGAGLKLSGFP